MILNQASHRLTTCAVLSALALGAATGALAQDRYKVSADGQEVQDSKTKLTWRRCAEGMSWNSKSCAGKATKFSYVNAQKYASAQASAGWRLLNRLLFLGKQFDLELIDDGVGNLILDGKNIGQVAVVTGGP